MKLTVRDSRIISGVAVSMYRKSELNSGGKHEQSMRNR